MVKETKFYDMLGVGVYSTCLPCLPLQTDWMIRSPPQHPMLS